MHQDENAVAAGEGRGESGAKKDDEGFTAAGGPGDEAGGAAGGGFETLGGQFEIALHGGFLVDIEKEVGLNACGIGGTAFGDGDPAIGDRAFGGKMANDSLEAFSIENSIGGSLEAGEEGRAPALGRAEKFLWRPVPCLGEAADRLVAGLGEEDPFLDRKIGVANLFDDRGGKGVKTVRLRQVEEFGAAPGIEEVGLKGVFDIG